MTSLVCWFAVDSRAVASVYVASDSRITAPDRRVLSDTARKVFACRTRPDLLGYCGNADKPPQVLAALVTKLDATRSEHNESAWDRAEFVVQHLNRELPLSAGHPYGQTKIVYASRDGSGHAHAAFAVFEISANNDRWDFHTLAATTNSAQQPVDRERQYQELKKLDVVFAQGAGASVVNEWREHWARYHTSQSVRHQFRGTTRTRTSRGVFSALCGALHSAEDSRSGGAPQLAALHQEGSAMALGVIWGNARYYEGAARTGTEARSLCTRWHDRLFQLCDPVTMQPLERAALHSAPARGLDPEGPSEATSVRKQRREKAAARDVLARQEARDAHRKRFTK